MKNSSLKHQSTPPNVGIYSCELHIKFTLIEEKEALADRDRLLEILIDALSCGADDFLEPSDIQVQAHEIPETEASAAIRRQLIRLRNTDAFL